MFDEPIRLTKALQAINARKDRTTHLKSREIAMAWNAEARARAFFSARVASATILSELHNKVQAVVEGRMTKGQARALLQRYFVGEGADALAALGFAPQGEGGGVAELASAARLRLILDMNVNMAQECGEYQRWAEMKDIYRYGMWKCGYAKEHREEHLARDGRVYAFDHPIWTESPPGGEFNCHCYRVLMREEDVLERGITPEPMDVPFAPSSLGFDPSRGMQKPKFGKRVRKEYRDKAQEQIDGAIADAKAKETPFPKDVASLREVRRLGGSTGARLMSDTHGNRFVLKRGGRAGDEPAAHLRNEAAADAFYQAAGVRVPEFRLYETSSGPVKLSRFIDDGQTIGEWWKTNTDAESRRKMLEKLRPGFDADVLIGNWDVIGDGTDNILIDPSGEPWRIDNGGCFGFRAQGRRKDGKDWASGWPDDLWSMRSSANNKPFFGHVSTADLAKSISGREWNLDALPEEDRKVVRKRLDEIAQIDRRGADFKDGGYTDDYIEKILKHSYNLSKEGFREEVPAQVSPGNWGFCRSNTPKGAPSSPEKAKEAEIKNKILSAAKTVNHHNGPAGGKSGAGDKKPNMQTVNDALAVKPELEFLAKKGNAAAQYYLDRLDMIKQAVKDGTTVPNLSTKHEIFTAPAQAGQASKYVSLTDHIHDYMKRNGGDVQFIMDWQKAQGGNSYNYKACEFKVAHLRAMGIKSMAEAKKKGYYMGWGKPIQEKNLKKAFSTLSKDQKKLDLYVESASQYQAAIQLLLENADFEGRDAATRTVILGRTEAIGKVVTVKPGELSPYARGPAESHSIFRAVVVEAGNDPGITIVRVPYSRINGCYFLERTPGRNDNMFLDDSENEFNADTQGLSALFLGKVQHGASLAPFRDKFLQFEKKHLN